MNTRPARAVSTRLRHRYRFALRPRWLALLALAALWVPMCIGLAGWQFDRLDRDRARNDQIEANSTAEPVEMSELAPIGGEVSDAEQWRAIEASGRYDTEHQLFVRNRTRDGAPGFWVLTPLVEPDGPAVLVNRGWVPAPRVGGPPEAPETPDGQVTVTGRLRPGRTADRPRPADVPDGQVVTIDVARIADGLPFDVYPAYLDLAAQDPPVTVVHGEALPYPVEPPGQRSELLHLSYAWQWYVFAAIGPIGALFLIRREARDRSRPGAPVRPCRAAGQDHRGAGCAHGPRAEQSRLSGHRR